MSNVMQNPPMPQITVTPNPRPFDIERARQDGWSDGEILEFLSREHPNFNVSRALDDGHSVDEIAQSMARGEGFSPSPYGALGAGVRGVNTALAGVVGAPVDIINAGLGLVPGYEPAEAPLGGSQSIRSGMNTLSSIANQLMGGGEVQATYDSLSQLPPEERWAAVAGEVVGGSLPFAMAPVGLAAAGARGPEMLQPILNAARQTPGRFLAAEAAAIGGGAQGAAIAELISPGNEMGRMIGEMGGAILSPGSLIARGAGGAANSVRNLVSSFTEGGRNRRAAEYIVQQFQRTGEDPTAVLEALRRAQDMPAPGTVGQVTGSPTVTAIENQLAGQSARFAAERGNLGAEGIRALLESADTLVRSGDPADLVAAARLRETAFNDMMAANLARAETEASEALARVGTSGQAGQVAASEEASSILSRALTDARQTETDLWGQIDRTVPIEPNAVLSAYAQGRARLLPDENLNAAIEGIVARMAEGQPVTSNELLLLRSRALEFARQASSGQTPDRGMAAIYGTIADGALADLSAQMSGDAVDAARAFTRSMHEAFTQTFAGRGVSTSPTGGETIAPELLLERAFGGGGARGTVQLNELADAAAFNQLGGPPLQDGLGPQMQGAQEEFLRSLALTRGTNPETGAANPNALARLLAGNETTFQQFPQVEQDIAMALSSQRALEGVQRRGQYATRVLGTSSPFGRLLRGETPNAAVRSALGGNQDSYMSLVNVARGGGPEAMDGLASATLDALMRDARSSSGNFSFERFAESLMSPRDSWSMSPLDTMVSQGVLDEGAAQRLQEIIRRASLIENPPSSVIDGSVVSPPDALTDLVTRIAGARIGAAGAAGQGAPLIAAGAGSRTATNLMGRMPQARIREALIEMVKDPALFEAAVSRAPTPQAMRDLSRQINAALINAGIDTGYEDEYDSSSSVASALANLLAE